MKPTYAELEAKLADAEARNRSQRSNVTAAVASQHAAERLARRALTSQAKAHKRAQFATNEGIRLAFALIDARRDLAESQQRTARAHERNDKLRKEVEALRGTHPDRYVEHFADSRQGSGFTFRKPDDTHIEAAEPYSYDAYLAAVGNMGFGRVIAWNNPGYTTVAKAAPKRRIVNRAHRLEPRMRLPLNRAHPCILDIGGFCGHISHYEPTHFDSRAYA